MRNEKGQFINGEEGTKTRYKKGDTRVIGNQFAKGNKPNKTTFGQYDTKLNKHPQWKGGLQKSKRDGIVIQYESGKRKPYARYIYEKVYGEIQKGYVVIHINWNIKDNDINNLDCISRAENLKRNRKE